VRGKAPLSWGEAESAEVAELARAAVVEASGQRGVRPARVDLREDSAVVYVLMLGGEYAAVWLDRKFGRWSVTQIGDVP
jgi:hypothetical protein